MVRVLAATASFFLLAFPLAAQEWQAVTEELIQREKPGYGKLCGVAVDHATGDLYINLSDRGLYRSADVGKTWQQVGAAFKGRTEWPGSLQIDPLGGKRMVTALVYGAPIIRSLDMGKKWTALDPKSAHVDWCAVDWSDPEMNFILTLKHEAADLMLVSRNGGKQFEEIGKGYGPAWIFDAKTAVVAQAKSKATPKPVLLRSIDGCRSFQPCGDYHAKALPRWFKDTLYWVVDGAIISTKDQGATWKKLCDLKDGRFGPIFGKSADHLFVLTQQGIVESTDGGQSWGKAVPVPKELKGVSNLTWMEYDPIHDAVFVMKMTSELYRWQRTKK